MARFFDFCCKGPATSAAEGEISVPASREVAVGSQPEEDSSSDLKLEIHDATLNRSFAKIGWMSPYAVITADGEPVAETKPSSHGSLGKSPVWEVAHTLTHGSIPHFLTIAVWDKNTFHKDVFCGAVSIPCTACMGSLEHKEFVLTKKKNPTGVVRISIHAVGGEGQEKTPGSSAPKIKHSGSLGGEFDHLLAYVAGNGKNDGAALSFKEVDHPDHNDTHLEDVPDEEAQKRAASIHGTVPAGPLIGSWHCVDTHGLEDFLKATGVGAFQRRLAMAASWPGWEFQAKGDVIHFINHSAIGDLIEDIPLDKEYAWKDGHNNQLTCRAEWIATSEGGTLKIARKGSIGDYTEERTVTGDKLEFVLTHGSGVTWGRSFERQK